LLKIKKIFLTIESRNQLFQMDFRRRLHGRGKQIFEILVVSFVKLYKALRLIFGKQKGYKFICVTHAFTES
jgi:hypothetical protein